MSEKPYISYLYLCNAIIQPSVVTSTMQLHMKHYVVGAGPLGRMATPAGLYAGFLLCASAGIFWVACIAAARATERGLFNL